MSIRLKVILFIIVIFFIGTLFLLVYIAKSHNDSINQIAQEEFLNSKETFENLKNNDIRMMSLTLNVLLANEEYKKLFEAGDREKLYEKTKPLFDKLKKNYNIAIWNFLTDGKDGRIFLRVQNNKLYNDAIQRATFLRIKKNKTISSGIELGMTAFALRVVAPCFINGKLIGYMELGEEIHQFLSMIKKDTDNDIALLLNKKYIDEKIWAYMRQYQHLNNNWNDYSKFILVSSTRNDIQYSQFSSKLENLKDEGVNLGMIKKNNKVYVRSLFPLWDASNNKVGGVFVQHDLTSIYNDMKSEEYSIILAFVFQAIIISIFIIIVLYYLIFRRLRKVIEIGTRVVGGDYNTKIEIKSKDEIGKYEEFSEQLRVVFVNLMKDFGK